MTTPQELIPPCSMCGHDVDECHCIQCPVCGIIGDPGCYGTHMPEEQITSRWAYSFNREDGSDGIRSVQILCDQWRRHQPGDLYVAWAGAPGTGKRTWLVTKKTLTGLYGVLLNDTVRILELHEVI